VIDEATQDLALRLQLARMIAQNGVALVVWARWLDWSCCRRPFQRNIPRNKLTSNHARLITL
jgi:hypothetical protein